MSTLITHIFNEEFLLPFFIKQHINKFDRVIVVDFQSTDRSQEIIRSLAPDWEIIIWPKENFNDIELTTFILDLEKSLVGPRMVLTATEFLIGNPEIAFEQILIPTISLINLSTDKPFDNRIPFHFQRTYGRATPVNRLLDNIQSSKKIIKSNRSLKSDTSLSVLGTSRSLHTAPVLYTSGRHFDYAHDTALLIYRVSNCFVSEEMFQRRLQIQTKIKHLESPVEPLNHHSNFGEGLTKQDLLKLQDFERINASDLSIVINNALAVESIHNKIQLNQVPTLDEVKTLYSILLSSQNFNNRTDNELRQYLVPFNESKRLIMHSMANLGSRSAKFLYFISKLLRRLLRLKAVVKK
jgi:glycosyltransferase involved in cell wall biosynthesis